MARKQKQNESATHPDVLYKLRTFDKAGYWRTNLLNSTLWCSSKDAFNDPLELQHELERHPVDVERVYDYWLNIYPHWRGQLALYAVPFIAAEMISKHIKYIGICCFTESATNRQMWAQYAADHTGFCLGFKFDSRPLGSFRKQDIHRVTYATESPRVPITVYAKRPYDVYSATLAVLTTKHTDWKHEREWRYLHDSANESVAYPSAALEEVIIGARTGHENHDELVATALKCNPEVRIREAIVIPRTYELGIRDVGDEE
jgi:hypothetical protein